MSTPPSIPASSPQAGGGGQEMHPVIPAVVSFFFPGLGLLLLKTRDRVKDALAIFGLYLFLVFGGLGITVVTFGLGSCCFLGYPVLSVFAAIHSYDEAVLLEGGKPLIFQKGFRLFKN